MTILNDIVENTRAKLDSKKAELPLAEIISKLNELNLPKGAFKESLLNKDQAIIAEIKKASPSAGIISEDFDPIKKAKEYEDFGASALSILTEEDFFQGSSEYLKEVKAITSLPILRKDFMIDEYQIYEAKLIGADCILLIASVLNDDEIQSFVDLAESLELDYLIEVHDLNELKRVEHFSNAMIGVNNRNLKTFDVDLNNSINLKNAFNSNNLFVAESGIKSQDDIDTLKAHDIHVFLIGESLMKGDFS
jgi:indole-3-glycerol phosphate synthase